MDAKSFVGPVGSYAEYLRVSLPDIQSIGVLRLLIDAITRLSSGGERTGRRCLVTK